MATIIYDDKEINVNDGEPIITACTDLGIPFVCRRGRCGSCKIEVLSGEENLSSKDAAEKSFGLGENERLACRCKIIQGEIEIDF